MGAVMHEATCDACGGTFDSPDPYVGVCSADCAAFVGRAVSDRSTRRWLNAALAEERRRLAVVGIPDTDLPLAVTHLAALADAAAGELRVAGDRLAALNALREAEDALAAAERCTEAARLARRMIGQRGGVVFDAVVFDAVVFSAVFASMWASMWLLFCFGSAR